MPILVYFAAGLQNVIYNVIMENIEKQINEINKRTII